MDPTSTPGGRPPPDVAFAPGNLRRRGIAFARRMASAAAAAAVFAAAARGLTPAPTGWRMTAPAFDPALARLADAQLVDRLPDMGLSRLNGRPAVRAGAGFAVLDGWVDLGAPDTSIPLWSPELRELIRRSAAALPVLLEHVSDTRPTRLVFAVARPRQPGAPGTIRLGDVYDSRALPAPGVGGVNTRAAVSAPVARGYSVKVGDLCYVAIGQIVNRRLFVFSETNAGFDAQGRFTSGAVWGAAPYAFRFVDSPVATPALAAAVRADWHGLDARGLADSLRADAAGGRDAAGALCRLLAYDPAAGAAAVHAAIQQVAATPGEANFWSIDWTVAALSPFWWDELTVDLTALGRKAIRQDRRYQTFADTRTNPLVTGTAQVIATCGARLVHRVQDQRLRAVVTEEIGRLRREREADGGAIGSVYDFHIERCEAVLRRLDGAREAAPGPANELQPRPAPAGLNVALADVAAPGMGFPTVRLRFAVAGVAPAAMAAARVGITNAVDDTGFQLAPASTPTFLHPAVGRVDDAVLSRNDPPTLEALLDPPPGPATRLVTLQGYVDLVVPGYDPAATVRLARVATTTDIPVASPALAAAHVTVTVFAAATCNAALAGEPGATDGPQSYGAQPRFHGPLPKGTPPSMFEEPTITDADVALGIADPGGRVVATEFVGPDGAPLHYNHNGWYHALATGGRRFDVYRLTRADVNNATLVLRLATGNALVRVPFTFRDMPLPANLH